MNFARQLREANAPPAKKFKSTAVPKGAKLAAGYVDRARAREDAEEGDVAKRIKALEEMVKLGQMEQDAFERVRDEIIGGNVKNVHLVKGLDRKLLERARRGEDVFAAPSTKEKEDQQKEEIDVDRALEELETKEVVPIIRTKQVDQDPSGVAGKKRTRDDILRDLKEARQKVTGPVEPQQQALGSRFRKVTEKLQPGGSRLEIDEKGREVLIVMEMDGTIKRKIKKTKSTNETVQSASIPSAETLSAPDKAIKLLGADVVIPDRAPLLPEPEENQDQDLFADVGTDYDPLAGLSESDVDAAEAENGKDESKAKSNPLKEQDSGAPRNYFNEKAKEEPDDVKKTSHDADFLTAIRKAAGVADRLHKTDDIEEGLEDDEEKLKKLARRREMLQIHDRDAEDLDLGFGSSRFDDQEDGEDRSYKLSRWKDNGGEDNAKGHDGQSKRKRGPKKKKGDKNNASDVLAVLERRAKT